MAFEMRPNTGMLFKNLDKDEDTHADYQGEALIDGQLYWFNAWIKEGKKGKFMSCSFRLKKHTQGALDRPSPKAGQSAKGGSVEELENDVPF
jgi:hypothetical protein